MPTPIALPGWQGYQVGPELRRLTGATVLVENDATAAAIGVRLYGVASGFNSFAYLLLGHGIGHIIVEPSGLPGICGQRGCLDRYVSLGSAYDHLKIADAGSHSAEALDDFPEDAGPALDGWLGAMVEPMRRTIDFLELALDPQTVVLGGPMPAGPVRSPSFESASGEPDQARVAPRRHRYGSFLKGKVRSIP